MRRSARSSAPAAHRATRDLEQVMNLKRDTRTQKRRPDMNETKKVEPAYHEIQRVRQAWIWGVVTVIAGLACRILTPVAGPRNCEPDNNYWLVPR